MLESDRYCVDVLQQLAVVFGDRPPTGRDENKAIPLDEGPADAAAAAHPAGRLSATDGVVHRSARIPRRSQGRASAEGRPGPLAAFGVSLTKRM